MGMEKTVEDMLFVKGIIWVKGTMPFSLMAYLAEKFNRLRWK